jgi:hypothetical protein
MSNMLESANAMAAHTAGERLRHRPRPLLLHLTGPTGVGKTLMASLVQVGGAVTPTSPKPLCPYPFEVKPLLVGTRATSLLIFDCLQTQYSWCAWN